MKKTFIFALVVVYSNALMATEFILNHQHWDMKENYYEKIHIRYGIVEYQYQNDVDMYKAMESCEGVHTITKKVSTNEINHFIQILNRLEVSRWKHSYPSGATKESLICDGYSYGLDIKYNDVDLTSYGKCQVPKKFNEYLTYLKKHLNWNIS